MKKASQCPECAAALSPDAPRGFCPQCLMKAGMESQDHSTDASERALLSTQAGASVAVTDPASTFAAQPEYVGSYRIVRVVGEGGMGIFY